MPRVHGFRAVLLIGQASCDEHYDHGQDGTQVGNKESATSVFVDGLSNNAFKIGLEKRGPAVPNEDAFGILIFVNSRPVVFLYMAAADLFKLKSWLIISNVDPHHDIRASQSKNRGADNYLRLPSEKGHGEIRLQMYRMEKVKGKPRKLPKSELLYHANQIVKERGASSQLGQGIHFVVDQSGEKLFKAVFIDDIDGEPYREIVWKCRCKEFLRVFGIIQWAPTHPYRLIPDPNRYPAVDLSTPVCGADLTHGMSLPMIENFAFEQLDNGGVEELNKDETHRAAALQLTRPLVGRAQQIVRHLATRRMTEQKLAYVHHRSLRVIAYAAGFYDPSMITLAEAAGEAAQSYYEELPRPTKAALEKYIAESGLTERLLSHFSYDERLAKARKLWPGFKPVDDDDLDFLASKCIMDELLFDARVQVLRVLAEERLATL